jgi:tetratricopeptide (TPR) repeat protein
MLPIFPFVRLTEKTQRGGAFDAVVEKTEKAIRNHSISTSPDEEHNPFMSNVWLLMGKAHVQNQDYKEAMAVFSHIVHLFRNDADVVAEAQLWKMRAYIETGRFCDAENLANILKSSYLPTRLDQLFTKTYTYLLFHKGKYAEALPYLQKTIDFQRNNIQRRRLQFLLGQTFAAIGENAAAFRAFQSVRSIRTPHELALNAVIQQSIVAPEAEKQQILNELQRMARRAVNENYFDKIHFAIGNIYLRQNDTTRAVQHYLLAEKERNTINQERTLAQIALADIFFAEKDFVQALPRYSETLLSLPETSNAHPRVVFRAEVLHELVPRLLTVSEQDSLQWMARLPRVEQEEIIRRHIAKRRESEREAEREAYLSAQFARAPQLAEPFQSAAEAAFALVGRTDETTFYFHNPQLVAQGRSEFQRRWGNRRLEDNWRTNNRQATLLTEQEGDTQAVLQLPPVAPHSIEFYLQQLPTTAEALAESNRIIEKNLFEIGNIAKNRLRDTDFAVQIFSRLLNDFPDSEYAEKARELLKKLYL